MEESVCIRSLGKQYRLYSRRKDRLKQLLSFGSGKFYSGFWALRGITLNVPKGSTTAIIGVNGSGKSTLLKIICGIVRPTEGDVRVDGSIATLLDLGAGFSPEFTGIENAYMNGALMGFTKKEMDLRMPAIVEFAGIGDFIDRPVKTYSSGMYVRLAFACAITVEPDILVVDEVLAVGDARFQQKCYAKIKSFRESGKTIILVTHDMNAVLRHAQYAVLLNKGGVAAEGSPRDVVNTYHAMLWESRDVQVADAGAGNAGRPASGGAFDDRGRFRRRRAYNPGETSLGVGKARIVDFEMLDEDGHETEVVYSGKLLRFRYEVLFDAKVENPVYGFMVRTGDGVLVYTTNTRESGIEVGPREAGEGVVVEFAQAVSLIGGDYFITVGVSEMAGAVETPLDGRYDIALLKVLQTGKAYGISNLCSSFRLKEGASLVTGRQAD